MWIINKKFIFDRLDWKTPENADRRTRHSIYSSCLSKKAVVRFRHLYFIYKR